jgi:hypothetical protein
MKSNAQNRSALQSIHREQPSVFRFHVGTRLMAVQPCERQVKALDDYKNSSRLNPLVISTVSLVISIAKTNQPIRPNKGKPHDHQSDRGQEMSEDQLLGASHHNCLATDGRRVIG